ncbi:hypothetical protein ANAPC1_01228 [Anaplasma phagocytophilum]|uniref:Uncharacterized protein n=1 Tax=Anaplasma phagocytophilum TaxID=948 RepID=A0AA45UU56_ANAPH|nr:hypothetical protein ANAPC1_01228 [Anaplasma phagocytophilum]
MPSYIETFFSVSNAFSRGLSLEDIHCSTALAFSRETFAVAASCFTAFENKGASATYSQNSSVDAS